MSHMILPITGIHENPNVFGGFCFSGTNKGKPATYETMISRQAQPTYGYASTSSVSVIFANCIDAKKRNNLRKIQGFAEYSDNWNGYGAKAFSPRLISTVKAIVTKLRTQPQLFPVADNSIQLEYDGNDGEYLEFQIYDNGEMHCYFNDGKGKETEEVLKATAVIINQKVEALL